MIVQLSTRNIAHIVFKRRRAVIGFFTACLVLNALYILISPFKYQSDAQVMVKINFNNPDLARPEFGANQNVASPGQAPLPADDVIKSIVVSYKSMAGSQDIERATLEKMTVGRVYPGLKAPLLGGTVMDKAIERFDADLDVKQIKDSNILQISLLNHDPLVAQQGVRTLLSEFIALQQNVFRAPTTAFIEGQLEVARAHVESEDTALRDFKVAHQLSSLDEERNQLLQKHTDVFDNLDRARSGLGAALARKVALQASLHGFEASATLSSGTDAMSRSLDDAQARLTAQIERANSAQTTYPANSPFVKNADIAVADARKRLADIQHETDATVRGGASPVYQAVQTDLLRTDAEVAAGQAQVAAVEKDLSEINGRLLEINTLEGQLHQLETGVQVARDNLRTQLQRAEESRISADLNKSQITAISIVQQPTLGYKIARPRWKLTTALALLFGVFGGLALGFLLESIDESFALPEMLEEVIGVPVLATLNFLPQAGS